MKTLYQQLLALYKAGLTFAEHQDLISISTAKAAPRDIATDLMKAFEIGEQSYATFKDEKRKKKFHDPMKMRKLKTFSNKCKKKEVKSNGRAIILKADRSLFGRIIVMAQGSNLEMTDILSHPLGPLTWALSTPDGLLRKTNKASLGCDTAEKYDSSRGATVVDVMNLVQRVKHDRTTFGEVAKSGLCMALRDGCQSKWVDVVFDPYKKISIKNSERSVRVEVPGHRLQSITASHVYTTVETFSD